MSNESEFDLVLWGATGFTGSLVAEYLARRCDPSNLNWAIAGRNRDKLEALRGDLTDRTGNWDNLPILLGDAFERGSLDEIATRTDVVCTTVGPYARFGTELVAACVEAGTDYCDLTGEVQWMRRTIDQFHEQARETGARIVHSCGFDSIPSDIGTLMVQQEATSAYDVPCSRIGAFVSTGSAEFSGGTVASAVLSFEEASGDPEARRAMGDPYSLAPEGEREGPDGSIQKYPRYDEDLKMWTAPFVMAMTNEKIVRRSNAILGYPYGRDFQYRECTPTGTGVSGLLKASGVSAGLGALTGALSVSPLRSLLDNYVLPDSGEGPDRDTRENGSFEVRLVGRGTEPNSGDDFRVSGKITANRDPGYGATAWMLGESAVCLALDETNTPVDAGILTPASGIGMPLVDRLRKTGMTFEVTHQTLEEA